MMTERGLPDSTGSQRITWAELPDEVAKGIASLLGSEVIDAVSQPGGFSEGVAARVRLADGGRAFIKAASSVTAAAAAAFHRREIGVTGALADTGCVPRLLHHYDDGTWVALVFEEIPGRLPGQPWRRAELDRVLEAVTVLAETLTPSPVDPALLGRPRLGGWQTIVDRRLIDRVRSMTPWAADNLDHLIDLERQAARVTDGQTLLHGDLYHFNVMLTPDRVFVIDWPHAWVGAAHCDVVTLLSSATASGIDPQPLLARHPLTRDLDPVEIDVVLALHAGFLLNVAATVGASADRTMVRMMVALASGSLNWLRSRL